MLAFFIRSALLVAVTYWLGGGLAALVMFALSASIEFAAMGFMSLSLTLDRIAKNSEQTLVRTIEVHTAVRGIARDVDLIGRDVARLQRHVAPSRIFGNED